MGRDPIPDHINLYMYIIYSSERKGNKISIHSIYLRSGLIFQFNNSRYIDPDTDRSKNLK
jgi:hypothetical protein|uniref:Uncharacterized protein n=1 Tax=Picea glauca TaxID=3330 RepID=A0A101LZC9_PICGL|nr:hypothetical protein ABT39_MTgene5110 [Picea glauca]